MQLFRKTNVDFLGLRRWAAAVSGLVILAGILSLVLRGGPRWGVDFAGGAQIVVDFQSAPDLGRLRDALADRGLGSSQVQEFGQPTQVLIRASLLGTTDESILVEVEAALDAFHSATGDSAAARPVIVSSEWVGPQVGDDLRRQALQAVAGALVGILLYVSYRFDLRYAMAAILALVHDVAVTLGAFSLADRELNLPVVAAALTIVGYSLNDTVVIFDRVRENAQVMRRTPYYELLNVSINQTLSRTILTSGTTLITVVTLYVLGGPMINDFAFALLVGIVAGTYSTIFIACPVAYHWELARERRRGRRPSSGAPVHEPDSAPAGRPRRAGGANGARWRGQDPAASVPST